jgi:ribosomal protein L11
MSHLKPYRTEEETPGQIQQIVRLRIKSGSATSGPPIGPVLGQYAIPISKFCTEFNERTIDFFKSDVAVFVTLHYLVDGSYYFTISLPITSICFSRAVHITQSTGVPSGRHNTRRRCKRNNWRRIGAITQYMLFEVVQYRTALGGTPSNTTVQITFYKCVGTVRSVGIVPYKYNYSRRKRMQIRQ